MKIAVDPSALLQCFLKFEPLGGDHPKAREVFATIAASKTSFYAPPHWAGELMSLIAQTEPGCVDDAMAILEQLDPIVVELDEVMDCANALAEQLQEAPIFTLYHAVALANGGTLITADERYYAKARAIGGVQLLRDFVPPAYVLSRDV